MEKRKNLPRTLEKFYKGEIPEKNALNVIREATPLELSQAEQELLKKGILTEDELKEFCKIHLKAVKEKIQRIKAQLRQNHPLRILITEHEHIKKLLDELEDIRGSFDEVTEEKKNKLQKIAKDFVEAEKHHEREEKTIFPRLEDKGVTGPPRIMKLDHEEFKPKKKRLLELSKHPKENKEEILELMDYLLLNLRDHIFKEDNILYPTALQKLTDWETIREEGDTIGYCDFDSFQKVQKREQRGGDDGK